MDYTSEYLSPERGKKVVGVVFKSLGEYRMTNTFEKGYPEFIMGHSTQDMSVVTLLPVLSTLDK